MKFVKAFFKHPWAIIVVCIAITGALGFFIKDLNMDNSLRMFFPRKDVSYARLTETEEEFGSTLVIGVSLEAQDGTILTPEYIQVIKNITDRILDPDTVQGVEGVDSLTHIDYVCSEGGAISASQLIPDDNYDEDGTFIGTPEMIDQIEERLAEWADMYNRVIVNDDNTGVQLQVTLEAKSAEQRAYDQANEAVVHAKENGASAEELAELKAARKEAKKVLQASESDSDRQQRILNAVRTITQEEVAGHNLTYKLFGEPSLSENSKAFMMSDLLRLIPLVAIVVLVSLFLSFKTLDGTLLPLITVLMSTAWTCGIMALLKQTFTLVSSVIPVALIAVGSAYGIHVLTHYYVALNDVEGDLDREKYENAIFSGLKEVWLAVLLAGITTVVGFISLVTSPIEPLHSFAIFTALGVAFSLITAVTFIPALLLVKSYKKVHRRNRLEEMSDKMRQKLDREHQRRGGRTKEEASGATMYNIFKFFCGTGPRLALFVIVITVLSIIGLRLLKVDTALINYFPKSASFRKDIDYVDERFAGTNSIYFNIQGQESGDITNPELLKAVDQLQDYLVERHEGIGKIVSLTTFIKRINQVWHDPATAEIADGSQADFGDDLDSWGDDGFSSWDDEGELDSWGDDLSFGFEDEEVSSFGFEDDSSESIDFVDPNITYTEKLAAQMTAYDVLAMLNKAYVQAGGKHATAEGMMAELEKSFNYKGMAFYEIPYDTQKYPVASRAELQNVVNDYLTTLSGSLDRFLDDDLHPSKMRVTCQLRNHSTEITGQIINDAAAFAKARFPEGYTIEFTGSGEMEYSMTNMIVTSQLTSLLLSLLSVFVIIAISFRSGWAGLLGAVPLALTILLNYMVMGFTHINLDLVTSIIASVAVGVGIDYTIHFLTTYREERSRTNDIETVTRQTFRKSGHGIVTNALAVGLGFLVLCLSKFTVLRYIGVLVAIVMFTSSFLAMTIIPGILNLFDPPFIRPKTEPKAEVVTDEE